MVPWYSLSEYLEPKYGLQTEEWKPIQGKMVCVFTVEHMDPEFESCSDQTLTAWFSKTAIEYRS